MQNRKVAIIDEDKKFLGEIKDMLLMGGYVPVVVDDAFRAVDTVVQSKPDVILLELRMPGKNGFELADSINRAFESRRIPLIAMANSFREGSDWLFDLCGIRRWLKKPFRPLDVIWAIENEVEKNNQWDRERCLAGSATLER